MCVVCCSGAGPVAAVIKETIELRKCKEERIHLGINGFQLDSDFSALCVTPFLF